MVHLWYLLLNLEREKEGRQGCYILMEGLIWYMVCRCFLKALTWNEEKRYFVLSANNFVSVFEVPHKKED